MREVKLLTADRGYVVTAVIPPFITMPAVLWWGDRHFLRETDEEYVECFAVAVVETKS